jgi:hypothetical protein
MQNRHFWPVAQTYSKEITCQPGLCWVKENVVLDFSLNTLSAIIDIFTGNKSNKHQNSWLGTMDLHS